MGARPAEWPKADFIVGNPPYMGQARQREAFGDGYVDSLRAAYEGVPDSADYVMYWWYRAANAIAQGSAARAGLITTNSITQQQNRVVVLNAALRGAHVSWAIPSHPWVDEVDGAAVRVALTVLAHTPPDVIRHEVDDEGNIIATQRTRRLNADLSAHADVAEASARELRSNAGLSSPGFKLHGPGFILPESEAMALLNASPHYSAVVKPYRNGRDVTNRPRGVYLIDFGTRTLEEAKEFPVVLDLVRDRVKPDRDANNDRSTREEWWKFGRNREEFRPALVDLQRYITTPETSKHRFFTFFETSVAPDNMLMCIACDDAFVLGALSSAAHIAWVLSTGATLEDRPRYTKSRCFDPFPFPTPPNDLRTRIAALAERLDTHRKDALARDERVTMTGMYNVVEKLRSGEALTPKERTIHELAACGVLRDLHDELDALVAQAYGWPWPMPREEILERLVALHDERVVEEKRGIIRWLRPEYQIPRFAPDSAPAGVATTAELALDARSGANELETGGLRTAAAEPTRPWPASAVEQLAAVSALVSQRAVTVDEAVAAFDGGARPKVERHLETLELMGEVGRDAEGRYGALARAS